MSKKEFQLGDEVRCKVTGFKGIITSKTVYLNGCKQAGVQAPLGKDGKWGENYSIDETQLSLIKEKKVGIEQRDAGGPPRRNS
jgi:hypothetical protein